MKKLNNKGMSLIEMIISFSLVCVAIVYFFETLFITNKIFRTTKEDTNNYVDVAYAFNIIEYCIKNNITSSEDLSPSSVNRTGDRINNALSNHAAMDPKLKFNKVSNPISKAKFNDIIGTHESDYIYQFKFNLGEKTYYYFFATSPKHL